VSRLKLKTGDVFSVPIDDERVGVGQIVATYGKDAYYFAIFDSVAAAGTSIDLDEALNERIAILALSLDAKLAVGHWSVVGNRPVRPGLLCQHSKRPSEVPSGSTSWTTPGSDADPLRAQRRSCSPTVRSSLPCALEKALRAKHGLEPWTEAYSDLAPNETTTTERLFR